MWKPWTLLVAITVTVSPDLSRRMTLGTSNTCLVTTVAGDVEGLDLGTSCAFLGIPYAAQLDHARTSFGSGATGAATSPTVAATRAAAVRPGHDVSSG